MSRACTKKPWLNKWNIGFTVKPSQSIINTIQTGTLVDITEILDKYCNETNILNGEGTITYEDDEKNTHTATLTPLLSSIRKNDSAIFDLVLNTKGIDVNKAVGYNKITPLIGAVSQGNKEMVAKLIEKVADINKHNNFYGKETTPLMYAVIDGNKEMVELLIEKGASIIVYSRERDATLTAVLYNKLDILKILFENVKPRDIMYYYYEILLQNAVIKKFEQIVDFLVENFKTRFKNQPDKLTTIINNTSPFDKTALAFAASNGNAVIVNKLLTVPGIDINCTDSEGETALHYAVINNHPAIVEILLRVTGINVNAEDRWNLTAYDYTKPHLNEKRHNYTDIINLLKKGERVLQDDYLTRKYKIRSGGSKRTKRGYNKKRKTIKRKH